MQVIIHRGTHQIGGCITQIRSDKGTRIAIDIGQNLPSKGKNKLCSARSLRYVPTQRITYRLRIPKQ